MVVLGGLKFLMSEVPLYLSHARASEGALYVRREAEGVTLNFSSLLYYYQT